MKRIVLLFLSLVPLFVAAQYSDIYFVPVKEKKAVVASSAKENGFTDIDDAVCGSNEYDAEYTVEDEQYYDDAAYEYNDDDDYRYSTRILRFRNPGRLVGSPLYWDLHYNYCINDWLVYDDGYYLNVYPTYSNPVYYSSWTCYDYWGWNRWHDPFFHWGNPYWGHHHAHHWYPGGGHIIHRPPHFAESSWRPVHRVNTDIPLNNNKRNNNRGTLSANASRDNGKVATNSSVRQERRPANSINRQQPARNTNRVSSSGSTANVRNNNNNAVRRQPVNRVSGTSGNVSVNRQNSAAQSGVRRQQPVRSSGSARVNDSRQVRRSSGTNVRSIAERSSAGGENKRRSSYSNSSSSSSKSGGYNRPSSTSVSRQRSSSSRGSSYSSGSTSRSSSYSGSSSSSRGSSTARSSSRR